MPFIRNIVGRRERKVTKRSMAHIWQLPGVGTGNVYAQERKARRGGREARESDVNDTIVVTHTDTSTERKVN